MYINVLHACTTPHMATFSFSFMNTCTRINPSWSSLSIWFFKLNFGLKCERPASAPSVLYSLHMSQSRNANTATWLALFRKSFYFRFGLAVAVEMSPLILSHDTFWMIIFPLWDFEHRQALIDSWMMSQVGCELCGSRSWVRISTADRFPHVSWIAKASLILCTVFVLCHSHKTQMPAFRTPA